MDGAKQDGSIDGQDQLFAKNKLIVIFPKSGGKITSIQDLAKPGLNLVLADPSVPVGNYARQVLTKLAADPTYGAGFDQKVLANLKSNEADDAATVNAVQLGQADAAIVYSTDVSPTAAQALSSIVFPTSSTSSPPTRSPLVKNEPNKAAGQAFIAYVRSAAGQDTSSRRASSSIARRVAQHHSPPAVARTSFAMLRPVTSAGSFCIDVRCRSDTNPAF